MTDDPPGKGAESTAGPVLWVLNARGEGDELVHTVDAAAQS